MPNPAKLPPREPCLTGVPAHHRWKTVSFGAPRAQCFRFTGIGPDAESNPAILRIKYGINPRISGICPIPAAESKVGYIPLFWHATVASSRCACTLRASAGARRGHDAGSALLRSKAVPTVLPGPRDVSCLVFFAQSARSCHFTLGGVGGRRSQRINLTQAVSR